jgi:Glycosyltransferase family 87
MVNDFIEYWSAVTLLIQGANPYSPQDLLISQQALGWSKSVPLVMWNPPWTLTFLLPFGLVGFEIAQFAWFLVHSLIIFHGARLLWQVYGGEAPKVRIAWLSAVTFAPSYFVFLLGQIGPLVLLGLVGFIYFTKRNAWGLAGVSLTLASIKPHLVLLLWLALLFDAIRKQRALLLAAFAGAGIISAGLPLLFNADIYTQYLRLFSSEHVIRPEEWATPSLGVAIGEILAIQSNCLRWLPSIVGAFWFVWYWTRRAEHWDWSAELPLLLLVSVTTASFVWTYDHIILLPAVVQGAVWLSRYPHGSTRLSLGIAYFAINGFLLVSRFFVVNDFWYFWIAPVFLFFYLLVRKGAMSQMINTEVH